MSSEWLSLSEMAQELGVHPSTIRNWADHGRIPVHRTPGGHRRFRRDEVMLWQQADQANTESETQLVIKNALTRTRFQISEGALTNQSWYKKLDNDARQQYRQSGRSLLQALNAYLSSESGSSADAEARALGYEYAIRARRHNLNIMEATQAFLFFRSNLLDAMYGVYEAASVQSPLVWSNLFRRITAFTDSVMLTIMETFTAFDR
ncbi:MAG: helix-turn-helix domain-containing protein [Anaerolineae bacterium]|nr:helix-turn-helix domain-containing protein [Anaerolineae bacterium]MBL6965912.1 helix-turn-helix domain-containing protein [Anaerolineales bacterium]